MFAQCSCLHCLLSDGYINIVGLPDEFPNRYPASWTMLGQLVVSQEVIDDDICCASANTFSSFPRRVNDMLQSSIACPNYGFAAPHPIMISSLNCHGQHTLSDSWASDGPSSSTGYSCHDSTHEQYSTQSVPAPTPQAVEIPPPQSIYSVSSPITAIMLSSISNHGSWHNPPTFHGTQYHDPVSEDTSAPTMGSNYYGPSPMQYALRDHLFFS
ncbi:hypothetical protein EDB19DRAFT_1679324 [Suillus lakei]|nr:hypothetical protein EDB19DRAFT_1679324 [Suillus lakei]